VLTVQSNDIENCRKEILELLLKHLGDLEIGIPFEGGILQAGVVVHLGDNLEVLFNFYLIFYMIVSYTVCAKVYH
jgi:hypothetical protein